MDLALAIEQLIPSAEYGGSTTGNDAAAYDALRWEDSRPKPIWVELEQAWIDWQTANGHIKARITAYPSIQEQLDMQYKDAVNGTATWVDAINKIKTDNPKGV